MMTSKTNFDKTKFVLKPTACEINGQYESINLNNQLNNQFFDFVYCFLKSKTETSKF